MRISLVTISYNQGAYLEECLTSVLRQGWEGLDYIVVDAGSTDGSRAVIERYRPRLSRVVLEPDRGPADGLAKGLALAGGEVLGWLNADDALLPGALAKVAAFFERRPEADVACGHGWVVDERGRPLRRAFSSRFSPRRYAYGGLSMLQPATFLRRAAYEAAGGLNRANTTCWDGELLLECGLRGLDIRVLDEMLALFRLHGGSISGSGRLAAQYARDQERLFRRALGRPRAWFDPGLAALCRLERWLLHPGVAWARLVDAAAPGRVRVSR